MTTKSKTSIIFKLFQIIQFHLICQMLAKFSGIVSESTISKCGKEKHCVVFTYSTGRLKLASLRSCSSRATMALRNVHKSVMHMQSCRFANAKLLVFAVLVSITVVIA